MLFSRKKLTIVTPEEALPGRSEAIAPPDRHFVNGAPMEAAFEGIGSEQQE